MTITIANRENIGSSGIITIIDGIEFEGFGSGGFGDNELEIIGDETDNILPTDIIPTIPNQFQRFVDSMAILMLWVTTILRVKVETILLPVAKEMTHSAA